MCLGWKWNHRPGRDKPHSSRSGFSWLLGMRLQAWLLHTPVSASAASKFVKTLSRPITTSANVALFGACLLATFLLHCPGHVPFDGVVIWSEARRAILSSQHPPMMALIWHYLEYVFPGPSGMLLLQLVTLWLCPVLLIERTRPSLLLGFVVYALLLVWPPLFAISGQLQKDMLGGHIAVLALIAAVLPPKKIGFVLNFAAASCLITVCMLLRYQYAVIFFGLFASVWWHRHHRDMSLMVAGACLAATAVTTILAMLAVSATFVRSGEGDVGQSVRKILIFDIAGVIANDPVIPVSVLTGVGVEDAELKRRVLRLYTPDRVDTLWEPNGVFALLDGVSDSALREQWTSAVVGAPAAFLAHRVKAFLRVAGVGNVYACWPIYTGISRVQENLTRELDLASYPVAASYWLLRHRYFPAGTFLFRPGLYGIVSLFVVLSFLLHRQVPFAAAVLTANGILYELTFFVLPQACDVRYSHFLILATLCAAAMVAFEGGGPVAGGPKVHLSA